MRREGNRPAEDRHVSRLGKRRYDKGRADGAAGHRLEATATRFIGVTLTAAVMRHVHLDHRGHFCGHATCLRSGQAHRRGDEDREDQCAKFPN